MERIFASYSTKQKIKNMKKIYTLISMMTFISLTNAQTTDSVNMNAGYAMDVFYSLDNSTVQTVANAEWTVALSAGAQTSSIYINDSKGVELYQTSLTPATFTNTLDTAGFETWTKLRNEFNDWDHSAFESGATGHPNYGWGTYNSVSHIVIGEKVFLLKTLAGTYYKASILKKENGAWNYRYATLDNSFDTTIVYQASDLTDRNFAYLNMDNHIISNREPSNTTWDLLFTKYYDIDESYNLTGVLLNKGVEVVVVDGVPVESATYVGGTFDAKTKIIGADWKTFDMGTSSYIIAEDRTYFVKQEDGDIYKLNFTRFDGSSTGKTFFTKEKVVSSGIKTIEAINSLSLYPNPAKNIANLVIDTKENAEISYAIYNLVGKKLESTTTNLNTGLNVISLDVANYTQGIYLVQVKNGAQTQTIKLNVIK